MYTVYVERECSCFKKSEYENEKTFETQKEAYNYANILVDVMNDDFCSKHVFKSEKLVDDDFIICIANNPNAGDSCSTDAETSCDSGSCGC